MIPSKIKIECFAKRCHMGTLGGKVVNKFINFNFLSPIPVHNCNALTAWFRDHQEFTVIGRHSCSPDLNPMENLWGIMVNEWKPDVLERHYMEVREIICRDPELCQQLVQSMRRECRTALASVLGQNPPPAKPHSDKYPNPAKNHRWQKLPSRWTC